MADVKINHAVKLKEKPGVNIFTIPAHDLAYIFTELRTGHKWRERISEVDPAVTRGFKLYICDDCGGQFRFNEDTLQVRVSIHTQIKCEVKR